MRQKYPSEIERLISDLRQLLNKTPPETLRAGVLLCSASPRRRDLLSQFIPDLTFGDVNIQEECPWIKPIHWQAVYVALEKMKACIMTKKPLETTIITSDTVVYYESENRICLKPENVETAEEMLISHLGKEHNVASASIIVNQRLKSLNVVYDIAGVKFNPDTAEIRRAVKDYLQLNPPEGPMDKAGAYGIQEDIVQNMLVEQIKGNKDTIIGIPLQQVIKYLK